MSKDTLCHNGMLRLSLTDYELVQVVVEGRLVYVLKGLASEWFTFGQFLGFILTAFEAKFFY